MALQAAVDRCHLRGGGVVVVPPGEYLTAPLFLKTNVELHLMAGSRLTASRRFEDYPPIRGRAGGVERDIYASLLTGIDLENVSISGDGVLDGNGFEWMTAWTETEKMRKAMGLAETSDGLQVYPPGAPLRYPRPRVINLIRCQNVRISDVVIERSPGWTLHLVYCENATVSRVKIRGIDRGINAVGIIVDSCRIVQITGCSVSSGDDGIAVKSGLDEDGRRVGIDCSTVIIDSCSFVDSFGAGIAIGSEMSGNISNVAISNCVFDNLTWLFRLKTNRGRGGIVEKVQISNLLARRIRKAGFMITGWHDLGMYTGTTEKLGPPETIPLFRDVAIRNVMIGQAPAIGSIEGLPEKPFENFVLQGIIASGSRSGLEISNVKGLIVESCELGASGGPTLAFKDCADLEVRQVRMLTTPVPKGTPAITLERVANALIADCRVPETRDRFVQLKGAANRGIVLSRNLVPRGSVPADPAVSEE